MQKLFKKLKFAWLAFVNYERMPYGLVLSIEFDTSSPSALEAALACVTFGTINKDCNQVKKPLKIIG